MTTATKIAVKTNEYVASHGRAPHGYGLWYFTMEAEARGTGFTYRGTFADALAHAKLEARRIGANTIEVMP